MQRPSGTGHVARMSGGEEAWLERGGRRGGGQGYTTQAADLQETSASQQRRRGHRRALRRGVVVRILQRSPGCQCIIVGDRGRREEGCVLQLPRLEAGPLSGGGEQ